MDLNIKKFGKFKLLQKIARGGMAEIFLACTGSIQSAHKFVVIKRISLMHSHSQEFNKMFQNEGKIAINLNHSNIGSIYEFGVEKDQYFICMEYISGRNIRQLVKKLKSQKKTLSVEICAHIIKYVCHGLDYAHNCTDNITGQPLNIIHRDVSPQNIMISFGGDIKVIDFGIAKIDDSESTKAGVLKGKFEYMSPEQARGKDIDKQTDIFSIGNVLWELLAGRKLFIGANEIQLLKKIRDCQIPHLQKINPRVPDKLVSIVHKALNANKHLRYKTVADMGQDISIFLNKHYPDWTNSHFSSFIKEIYIEEIMEERQNLKAYSQALKQSVSTPARIKSKSVLQETYSSKFKGYTKEFAEKTQMEEHTADHSNLDETVSVIDKDFEDEDSQWTKTATRSHITEKRTAITKTKFDDPLDSKTTPSALKENYTLTTETENRNTITTSDPIKKDKSSKKYAPWYSPHKSNNLINQKRILKRRNKKRGIFQKAFMSLFVIGALSSSYFFSLEVKTYVLNLTEHIQSTVWQNNNPLIVPGANNPEEREEIAEKKAEKVPNKITRTPTAISSQTQSGIKKVFLSTRPSGAQVYIDGVEVNDITPTSISIFAQKKVTLLIKKTGYYDKKVTLSPKEIKSNLRYSLTKAKGANRNEVIIR